MEVDTSAFDLPGDARGALLIHGFTGTPFELRHLGEHLHGRGLTVVGLRLPGHGSAPAALERTRWTDWAGEVERGFDLLARRCRRVAVVGQSLGGLLALHLAAGPRGPDLAALAVLGTPLRLGRGARAVVAGVRLVPAAAGLGPLRKSRGSDVADRALRMANPAYPVIPLRALVELDDLRRIVRAELARVTTPLLIVHALHDHVAPFASADEIARGVRATEVERLTLPRSFHIVAMDLERERVADEVGGFLERHLAG